MAGNILEAKRKNLKTAHIYLCWGVLALLCSTYVSPSAASRTAAVMAVAGLELPVTLPT
jgi:hypothetical protein